MTSPAQAAANQANAQFSTGPRTEEGKARSAQNARKHGLTARDLVLRDDERQEFEGLQASLIAELDPQGAIETLTFNQLLHAAWNLQRYRRLEADLQVNGLDPLLDDSAAQTLERLSRYAARAERAYYRAIKELRALQTNRGLRAIKLSPEEAAQVPAIADINELTKRTHSEVQAAAIEMAIKMMDYEAKTYLRDATRHSEARNEPKPA